MKKAIRVIQMILKLKIMINHQDMIKIIMEISLGIKYIKMNKRKK